MQTLTQTLKNIQEITKMRKTIDSLNDAKSLGAKQSLLNQRLIEGRSSSIDLKNINSQIQMN